MVVVVVVAVAVREVEHTVYYAQAGSVLALASMGTAGTVGAPGPASAEAVEPEERWRHSAVQLVQPRSQGHCSRRGS